MESRNPEHGPPAPVLVTGGSRGIGEQVVRLAVEAGHPVAFTYARRVAEADALATELRDRGRRVVAVQADVADLAGAEPLLDQVEATLGPVRHLVNNAGVPGRLGRFADVEDEELRRVLEVNVLGTMAMSRAVVRRWEAAGAAGTIVNLSSVAATTGSPGEYVHYAASKAAVDTFTVGLAKEVGRLGIRVNAVQAGTARTEIHAAAGNPGRPEHIATIVPIGRVAEPEEIAAVVLWLMSSQASYVTGSVVRASGGL
jgi:NAD(P)-dependent dehydrogenase (short-subunit alcohol dehydrogenase family)